MSDLNQISETLNPGQGGKQKLPGALGTLTILTFIGCGIGLIFTFLTSWFMNMSSTWIAKAEEMADNLSPKELAEIEKAKVGIAAFNQNKMLLIVLGLVCIALCIVGAIQMRKLKKTGFYIYVAGELLPIVYSTILLGFGIAFNGIFGIIVGLCIPILFVILYARQLKHLS
jgi:uncharacterized BrkB/YihY/UPF0761 family membrane protein